MLFKKTVEFHDVSFKFFDFVSEFVYLHVKTMTFIKQLTLFHFVLDLQVFEKPARGKFVILKACFEKAS